MTALVAPVYGATLDAVATQIEIFAPAAWVVAPSAEN